MPYNTLDLSFLVNETSCQVAIDCQFSVVRRYAHLRFGSTVRTDEVPIAYLKTPDISIAQNLVLNTQIKNSLIANVEKPVTDVRQANPTFSITNDNFQLTDVMVPNQDGNIKALYSVHSLPLNTPADSAVQVLDQNLNQVDPSLWLHWRTEHENSIYSNLTSSYDPKADSSQIYFITYLDSTGVQQTVLLANQLVFTRAQVEDYANFAPWRRLYSISTKSTFLQVESLFKSQYSPTKIPWSNNTLSYRVNKSPQGLLHYPMAGNLSDPWFPRIKTSRFFLTGLDHRNRLYRMPEYDHQIFLPYEPYKVVANSPATIINSTLLKATNQDLQIDPANDFHLDISIYKYNGEMRYAFTTDPGKFVHLGLDGKATGAHYRTDGINSYDQQGGFIQLKLPLNPDDQVYLTYRYHEKTFEYLDLNLNPLFTSASDMEEHYIYLVPEKLPLQHITASCISQTSADQELLEQIFSGLVIDSTLITGVDISGWGQAPGWGVSPGWGLGTTASVLHANFFDSEILIIDDTLMVVDNRDRILEAVHAGQIVFVNHGLYTSINLPVTGQLTFGTFVFSYTTYGAGFLIDAQAATMQDHDGIAQALLDMSSEDLQLYRLAISQVISILGENLSLFDDPTRRLYHFSVDANGAIVSSNHPYLLIVGQTLDHFKLSYSTLSTNCFQFQILGSFNLSPNSGIAQVLNLDARRRGGGVNPELAASLSQTYPEIRWCFDQARFDGHPYPAAAAILLEFPWTMLSDYGGDLSRKQIAEQIDKHLALGVYPVIRYHGNLDPSEVTVEATDTTAHLTWVDYGGPYTVYWDILPKTLRQSQIVAQSTLSLTNLTPDTTYYYLVTNIRDNSRVLEPTIRSFTTLSVPLPS